MSLLAEFIVISFAAFMSWQLIRHLAWFEIPVRVAPFVILIPSLLFALPFSHSLLLAVASAGGVGALNLVTKAEGIAPLQFSRKQKEIEKAESRKIYLPDL